MEQFLAWVSLECRHETAAGRMVEEARVVRQAHPDWTLNQVREEVLTRAYNRTLAQGDFDLGLRVVRVHVATDKALLDREKFEWAAAQKCYDDLPGLQAIRQNSGLTIPQKMRGLRLKLFGRIAEEQPQPLPLPQPQPQ